MLSVTRKSLNLFSCNSFVFRSFASAKKKTVKKKENEQPMKDDAEEIPAHRKFDYILGLDINTRSTGFAVLDRLDLEKGKDIYEKAAIAKKKFEELNKKYQVKGKDATWLVAVEAFLKAFSHNVFGLFKLAQLNGLVCYDCVNLFGMVPVNVHTSQIRSHFDIKSKSSSKKGKKKSEDEESEENEKNSVKKIVWLEMSKKVKKGFEWPVVERRSKDLPLIDRLKDVSFDITDALAIATYAWKSAMEKKVQKFQNKVI